jgi:voltage-gated potassium channel
VWRRAPLGPLDRLRIGDHAPVSEARRASPARQAGGTREQLWVLMRRLGLLATLLVALLLLGAAALSLSEGVGLWYGFRWALDTAATAGGFPQPRSVEGQITLIVLIIVGVGTLFYALAMVTEVLVAGHVGEMLALRRTEKMIDSLTGHHIVCGFGRVGRQVARDLRAARAEVVVIDSSRETTHQLAEHPGVHFIEGDATDDDVLVRAGIERARSIIACADSDANNVFITLTARELRSDIRIVARAAIEDTEKKLKRAGADRVISPYKASGTEMARLALHRQLSGVVDVDEEYRMEEIVVARGCAAVGRTVGDIRGDSLIVGIRRGAEFAPQPPADMQLRGSDVLVAMGNATSLARLEGLLEASAHEDGAA